MTPFPFYPSIPQTGIKEGKKLAKQEKKTCPHCKSSSGPAMPEMFIKCHDNRIDFQNEDEFYKQFDICTNHPEDCETAKNFELLSQLLGKEIRTHYSTGGIVTNINGPHKAYGPGSWTINYTKDGKKSKSPCIIR